MFISDVCRDFEFACGAGFCVEATAQCDGFVDCVINRDDEALCSMSKEYSKLFIKQHLANDSLVTHNAIAIQTFI